MRFVVKWNVVQWNFHTDKCIHVCRLYIENYQCDIFILMSEKIIACSYNYVRDYDDNEFLNIEKIKNVYIILLNANLTSFNL